MNPCPYIDRSRPSPYRVSGQYRAMIDGISGKCGNGRECRICKLQSRLSASGFESHPHHLGRISRLTQHHVEADRTALRRLAARRNGPGHLVTGRLVPGLSTFRNVQEAHLQLRWPDVGEGRSLIRPGIYPGGRFTRQSQHLSSRPCPQSPRDRGPSALKRRDSPGYIR